MRADLVDMIRPQEYSGKKHEKLGGPMRRKPALLLGIPMLAAALLAAMPAHAASLARGTLPRAPGTPPGNKIWNGYVYLKSKHGKLTSKANFVRAWWIVPPAACGSLSLATDSMWVGLGGLGKSLLVQAGTITECSLGGGYSTNGTWEIVPPNGDSNAVLLSGSRYPVSTGDLIFAAVGDLGGGRYSMNIQDESADWGWSKTVSLRWKAEPSTADWIVESGSKYGLANFGSVAFTNCAYDRKLISLAKATKFEADTPPQTRVSAIHYAPNASHFVVTWRRS